MATYHDGAEIDRATHSINYTEFTVKKKTEGMLILAKIGLILLYIGIVAVIWALVAWMYQSAAFHYYLVLYLAFCQH